MTPATEDERVVTPADVERRNREGMRRALAAKRRQQRAAKPPRPKPASDQRKYGKRGWTWTP